MKYDLDGRRIQSKTVGSLITETNYLWDTTTRYGDVLLETTPNADFRTRYSYGANELIGQKRGTDVSFVTDYYLLDGQGSVRGLTGDTGTLTQEYTYDTFGKLTSGDASKSAYLYTGQQYDGATELYSLRARYYSPQQGRFLSQDTWQVDYQNPMELNRYGYSTNNPINYRDPSGLSAGFERGVIQTYTDNKGQTTRSLMIMKNKAASAISVVQAEQIAALSIHFKYMFKDLFRNDSFLKDVTDWIMEKLTVAVSLVVGTGLTDGIYIGISAQAVSYEKAILDVLSQLIPTDRFTTVQN
jgi:RHS repeat-associated protein